MYSRGARSTAHSGAPTRRVSYCSPSHTCTRARMSCLIRSCRPDLCPKAFPRGFVRLVYSLGYGENSLLDSPVISPRNSGTPQYWKIFQSCVATLGTSVDYSTVQISRNRDPAARLSAKLAVLAQLKEQGIWLAGTPTNYPTPRCSARPVPSRWRLVRLAPAFAMAPITSKFL